MIDVGPFIRQGGPPHGGVVLGQGPRTFAEAGCFFCCWVMTARVLTGHRGLTAIEAHDKVRRAGGFVGSGLKRATAARALGMRLADADGSEPFSPTLAESEFREGRPVIAGVDFRVGRSSGFSDADHFILLVGDVGSSLRAVDPARGQTIDIRDPSRFVYGKSTSARLVEVCRLVCAPN